MKRFANWLGVLAFVSLLAGTAHAENIAGRIGVTGRIGFLVPADSETTLGAKQNIGTDVGFVGGGGVIYGVNRNIAAEFEITHTEFDGRNGILRGRGNFETNAISLGAQYRFNDPMPRLTPYLGGGLDILVNDFTFTDGVKADVDTTVGLHAVAGADYFFMKQMAFNTELKLLVAPDVDMNDRGTKFGNYDPSSFSMTFGVRYFFN
jgi:outer membrane protein